MQLLLYVGDGAALADEGDALFQLRAGEAFEAADEAQVLGGLHLEIERRRFGQIADAPAHFEGLGEDVVARDRGRSRGGREEAGEHAHGGGFTGAVGAQEAYDLAFVYGEGDVVNGGGAGVTLGQVCNSNHRLTYGLDFACSEGLSGLGPILCGGRIHPQLRRTGRPGGPKPHGMRLAANLRREPLPS